MKFTIMGLQKSLSYIANISLRRHYTVTVPPDASNAILDKFLSLSQEASPYDYEQQFDRLSEKATDVLRDNLPTDIQQHITDLRDNSAGHLEITGIPTDPDLMDTPNALGVAEATKKTFVPELFSMGLAGVIRSKVYNFRQEGLGTGALIFNIFPVPGREKIKGAGGVAAGFGFHMENAWHPQRPDYLILTGLRQDHDKAAITYSVANEKLLAALTPEEVNILMTHAFTLYPPEVHKKMEKEKGILFTAPEDYVGPVIIKEETGYKFMVNFNGMTPVAPSDEKAQKALDRLQELAGELADNVKLRPGNALIINNNRALHTRNGYTPHYDGKDRWFQRYYLINKEKLWPERSITPETFLGVLPPTQAMQLIDHLQQHDILDKDGKFTAKFAPHKPDFVLPLPDGIGINLSKQIMRQLMQRGPAAPHRML